MLRDDTLFKFDVELRKFEGGKIWKEMEVDGVKGVYVEGYASTEALDKQGEKVARKAIEEALPDYLKTPSIKEMHNPFSLIGKAVKWLMDDKGLFVGSFIVDPGAISKVKMGMFTGYSIGGKRLEKFGNTITKLLLTEISLVDRGANPEATLLPIFKLDYTKGENMQKKDKYQSIIDSLDAVTEAIAEGDSDMKAELQPVIESAFAFISEASAAGYVDEMEGLMDEEEDTKKADYLESLAKSLEADMGLVSKSEIVAKAASAKIQLIHDQTCEMGALCSGHPMTQDELDAADGGLGDTTDSAGLAKKAKAVNADAMDDEESYELDGEDEEMEKGRVAAFKDLSMKDAATAGGAAGSTVVKPKPTTAMSKTISPSRDIVESEVAKHLDGIQESISTVANATLEIAKYMEELGSRIERVENTVPSAMGKSAAPKAFDKDGGAIQSAPKSKDEESYDLLKGMFDVETNPVLKQELGNKLFGLQSKIKKA